MRTSICILCFNLLYFLNASIVVMFNFKPLLWLSIMPPGTHVVTFDIVSILDLRGINEKRDIVCNVGGL